MADISMDLRNMRQMINTERSANGRMVSVNRGIIIARAAFQIETGKRAFTGPVFAREEAIGHIWRIEITVGQRVSHGSLPGRW